MLTQRTVDLSKLNSLTKYPSIPTYHSIDRGILGEVAVQFDGPIYLTEKIDGTNARIILLPDGTYILGSREELVYASGDLIGNPSMGIAEHLRPVADRLAGNDDSALVVVYGELYGGKVTANSKHYTSSQAVGFRVFDVAVINVDKAQALLDLEARNISQWRDSGGQIFLSWRDLEVFTHIFDLETVPQIGTAFDISEMHIYTYEWIKGLVPKTMAALDGSPGKAEGIVARSADRRSIAKLRFDDYEKTLSRKER